MRKKGISLIVLVITIIVIVIIATAAIVTFVNNNPISNAKKAVELWGEKMTKEEMILKEVNGVIDAGKNRWDGTVATSYASGKGTEKEPYIIETPAQLAYLASEVNSGNSCANTFFRITKSMDLENKEWTPIGNGETDYSTVYNVAVTNKFSGHIDGTGITIDNLNIEELDKYGVGLIGVLDSGSVKNIILRGSIKGKGIVGGVVGVSKGSTVTACINRASIIAIQDEVADDGSGEMAGGMVGLLRDSSTITECLNYAKVETTIYEDVSDGGKYAGGIVGRSITSQIDNCENYGNIVGVGSQIGGISGKTELNATISNCKNFGKIEVYPRSNYTTSIEYIGGITGCTLTTSTVSNCENLGEVVSTGNSIGGIVGHNAAKSIVENCKNMGSISIKYSSQLTHSSKWIGGVTGQNVTATVSNCSNYGKVYSEGNLVGGISGRNINSVITSCVNNGYINTLNGTVGGITAINSGSNPIITKCSNYGNVTTSSTDELSSYAGGIVGYVNATFVSIDSCYNSGNITVNTTVEGSSAGGIVGYQSKNTRGVKNSYSKGVITAPLAGCVIGVNGVNAIVENTYYYTTEEKTGIGFKEDSSSNIVAAPDENGVTKKITNEFMNLNEFLSWLNK